MTNHLNTLLEAIENEPNRELKAILLAAYNGVVREIAGVDAHYRDAHD